MNEYKYLIVPIITLALCQIIKFIVEAVKTNKLDFKRLFNGSGGMPSSHTACITSLATSIGIAEGFGSPVFALSVVFCFIVMYDAAGVRRAAGKQAAVLNKIIESDEDINVQEKLVELIGHTPLQVVIGAIVGIVIGIIFSMIWDL